MANIKRSTDLLPIHQGSTIGKILDSKCLIQYHTDKIAPRYNEMEKWEQNEYTQVFEDEQKSIAENIGHIKQYEDVFNGIVCKYGFADVHDFIDSLN